MEEELTSKDAKTMMKDIFGEESDIEAEPKERKINQILFLSSKEFDLLELNY